jgi:molecular chaperone DnaJ
VADYYGALGVAQGASDDEIKKAYRKLARSAAPGRQPRPEAQERFKAVTAAYEVLSDPQKRQVVDLGGDPLSSGPGSAGSPFTQGFGGLGDIMDAFFGGGRRHARPRSRMRQGADALIRIECDLAETAFGVDRELTLETAVVCTTCRGQGTAPGHPPLDLRHLPGPRRGAAGAALVPRPGHDDPRLPALRRPRHDHRAPVRRVQR